MNIAICDDNRKEIAFIKKVLEDHFQGLVIVEFYDGSSLINYLLLNKLDIVLLDIEMPGLNGIETAKSIRSLHPSLHLVFITGHSEFALEAFGVYAFDFIIKPISSDRLIKTINLVSNKLNHYNAKYVDIHNRGTVFRVMQEDIFFIEKSGHRCIVHTKDFIYNIRTFLHYFEEKLDPELFIKTHKGFIVNKSKITKITARGNLAYDIHFSGTDKRALLSRGMNDKLGLI